MGESTSKNPKFLTLPGWLREWLARQTAYGPAIAVLIEIVVFSAIAPGFFTLENFINISLQTAIFGILAVGMTLVILTGGIDLSVGSVVALAGVSGAMVAQTGGLGMPAAILVGGGVGLFSGLLVAYFRVAPFVVTLAGLTIARGLAFLLTGGRSIGGLPPDFTFWGQKQLGLLPLPVLILVAVVAGGYFLLTRTVFGRQIYAIGGNAEASWLAGVPVQGVLVAVYLINGLLAGLAGGVLAARLGAGIPNSGQLYELEVIAAVVVGGTSLSGGRGGVLGSLLGALFIGTLGNGLNLLGVDPYLQKIVLGVVILAAVLVDSAGRRGQR
ncbi:ABC transporter permease [Gloeobacter morelensis]|uniref:ABC transporter permease n=1 Tax=Gloeobacter morelensis MG652769 TaxID=2781736 RepID=A0ABY3PJS8_9CYAN|nr:ABC transporter permease [Gloeobacter morelensis]UFP93874.1 ABC transporter permease [Gloeobacter morelensis MG652769]